MQVNTRMIAGKWYASYEEIPELSGSSEISEQKAIYSLDDSIVNIVNQYIDTILKAKGDESDQQKERKVVYRSLLKERILKERS